MSPYFTSSPPVYAKNWANVHNLVESTKIERQVVLPSKRAHRKEKKDKKKTKKEKKLKNEKSIEKLYFPVKKLATDESEQLEKSCLTEEHEQRLHVGYLSDGSHNSKKRRKETSPAVESNIKATPVAGNPLRIRFVFKKPKEVETVPQEDRVCSTSGAERPIEISSSVSCLKTSDHVDNLVSTSVESEKLATPSDSKKRKKHKTSKESRYNRIFDEWVPPCISIAEDDSNSDDWLLPSRREGKAASNEVSIKNDEDMIVNTMSAGDSSFPRAQFLPEVEIFSLPYTVPF